MKLCKDCKHAALMDGCYYCESQRLAKIVNPIDGSLYTEGQMTASSLRFRQFFCGYEGTWWEAKTPPIQKCPDLHDAMLEHCGGIYFVQCTNLDCSWHGAKATTAEKAIELWDKVMEAFHLSNKK